MTKLVDQFPDFRTGMEVKRASQVEHCPSFGHGTNQDRRFAQCSRNVQTERRERIVEAGEDSGR